MLSIPNPCKEDFSKMTPTQRGAFCNKCAIDTYDFRKLSNLEIKEILLEKSNEPKCGQFYPKQIDEFNRNAQIAKRKPTPKYYLFLSSLVLLISSCTDVVIKTGIAKSSNKTLSSLYYDDRVLEYTKPYTNLTCSRENYTFLPPPPIIEDEYWDEEIEDEDYIDEGPIYDSKNMGESTEINAVIIRHEKIYAGEIQHTAGVPVIRYDEYPKELKSEKRGFFKRIFNRKK